MSIIIIEKAKIGSFGNVFFKWPIIPYFFWKDLQLQIKCALSMIIQANYLQNVLFQFCIVCYQKREHDSINTFGNPKITKYSSLSTRFQIPRFFAKTIDISNITKILHLTNYCYWSSIRAIIRKITKAIPLMTLEIVW